MNYWILTTAYEKTADDEIGAYTDQQIKAFSGRGHQLHILFGRRENKQQTQQLAPDITLHSFSLKGRESAGFLGEEAALSYEFANEVIRLPDHDRPDFIEVQEYLGIGYYLLLRKQLGEPLLQGIPIIVRAHGPLFLRLASQQRSPFHFPEYWIGEMEKFCLLSACQLIAADKQLMESIQSCMTVPLSRHPVYIELSAGHSADQLYQAKMKLIDEIKNECRNSTAFPIINPQAKTGSHVPQQYRQGLTVVIPYFNMGKYIEECVASIYASSCKNVTILIINDGSTDQFSLDKLILIQQQYPAVKIIHQDNAGLSGARNTGLQNADSEFIMFLDPDDSIHPDYFTRAIQVLTQYDNISFVSCWLRYFGASSGVWPGQNPELPYLLFHNTVHSGCVFKFADLLQTGGYDNTFAFGMEDYELTVHLVSKGLHGVCIPEVLYNYRIREKSLARSFTHDRQIYLYWLIAAKHRHLFNRYGYESISMLNANGPGYLHDNPSFKSRHLQPALAFSQLWKKLIRKIRKKSFISKTDN
ncbi:MAG: glycosyltransferase [Candidatus Pseudobacter hemicellulosilyticus]|uniref:Glycosyltransferase n=1 Tax=Candidatus Pseudobacter hemicellulosilyticus TaxID=3121375 RepID=A0AAJ6BHU1_9BACT|nr:MAG: glycosyltransferase [Pseudobacter sp.]